MLTSLWEGLGGNPFNRWVVTVLAPAAIFWSGGAVVLLHQSGWSNWEIWLINLPDVTRIALLLALLLGILVSSSIVHGLAGSVVKLLEGYWPKWVNFVAQYPVNRYWTELERMIKEWQQLKEKEDKQGKNSLSRTEDSTLRHLERLRRSLPVNPANWMSTRLGNILRASESRPLAKYGLSTGICWPRLWLLLPSHVQKELEQARLALDTTIMVWTWAVLFTIWGLWVWWMAFIGLGAALLVYYFWILQAAEVYGELVESVFDLYRTELFKTLRWPLPANPVKERELGAKLTEYLARGLDEPAVVFTDITDEHRKSDRLLATCIPNQVTMQNSLNSGE